MKFEIEKKNSIESNKNIIERKKERKKSKTEINSHDVIR